MAAGDCGLRLHSVSRTLLSNELCSCPRVLALARVFFLPSLTGLGDTLGSASHSSSLPPGWSRFTQCSRVKEGENVGDFSTKATLVSISP